MVRGPVLAFCLFLILLSWSCYSDGAARTDAPTRAVTCLGSGYMVENLCEDEKEYLDQAAAFHPEWGLADLSHERLQKIVKETKDVDQAAALFFHRAVNDPRNRVFLKDLERLEGRVNEPPAPGRNRTLLAVAPGMFYADNHDEIDTTGSSLRSVAKSLGFSEDVIPTEPTGTVDGNGEIICKYIEKVDRDRNADRILLASASKGSADIRMAMKQCGHEPYFRRVSGWMSMGGILHGSHLVDGVLNDRFSRWRARFYFWVRGYNWEGLRSLRHSADGPLAADVAIPAHVTMVNIIGVPLFRHVTQRARPFYLFLVPQGPSDGIVLLADAYVPGALVYASFRNDHYFQWPIPEPRIKAFLLYMAERAQTGISGR